MPFDGITTKLIGQELNHLLAGGRVRKIYQPEDDELRLLINTDQLNYTLLISTNPSNARIHITDSKKKNPEIPPTFCMTLRKYLTNSTIDEIKQLETDRVLSIIFSVLDEFGEPSKISLIIEITGKNSNVILTRTVENEEHILDSMKKINALKSSYRQILPGYAYLPPPTTNRVSFININQDELLQKIKVAKNKTIEQFLVGSFLGISPAIAREIAYRAGLDSDLLIDNLEFSSIESLVSSFYQLLDEIDSAKPQIYENDYKFLDFSGVALTHLKATTTEFSSFSQMLETFFEERDRNMHFRTKSANIRHQLENLQRKQAKKLQNLDRDLKKAQKNANNKLYGDLITTYIYQLERGMTEAQLLNYMSDPPTMVRVPLKANETPSQNAQRFYKKYNKNKRAQVELTKQIEKTNEDLNYIESLLNSLEVSSELEELNEIVYEFNHSDLVPKPKTKKQKSPKPSRPMHYISSEGFDIYVGKNNYQNDYIVTRLGKDEDCWLHVKNAAGSHVLIVADGKFIPEQTVLEGGMLAAHYSKLSQSENIPVDYLEFKFLKKPKKSKPGFVTFTEHNTMYITPDQKILKNLKKLA